MSSSLTVSLGPSCIESLRLEEEGGEEASRRLVSAVSYFLAESSQEAGHAYPEFRRREGDGPRREFELLIPTDLWRRFTAEAERQQVSPDRLLEHSAFYFAAQADAGRLAEGIARDLLG